MKDRDSWGSGPVKSACQAELVRPSPSPQLTTSSVNSKDRVIVPVQNDVVHSEAAILVTVPVAEMIWVVRKETNVSRNRPTHPVKGVKTSFHLGQGYDWTETRAFAGPQGHRTRDEVGRLVVMMGEVRILIVGGSEGEVVIVCFLPAGGLEGLAEINEGIPDLDVLTIHCCVDTISKFCQQL